MTRHSKSLLGGQPAFAQPLHVGRPNIGNAAAIHRRIDEILERKWLSNDGVLVQEFEGRIASLVGVKHCLAVTNATIGLEIACRAAGLSGEVIIPANTFVATAHALQWLGITPVFCDIDPATHNLDPAKVEDLITEQTTGLLGVHLWGRPCNAEQLQDLAERHDLALLFDAAHAFGCSRGGKMIGGLGLAEVFSFHATKFVNCGEGGAIVTNDDEFASHVRRMRSFGIGGCDQVTSIGTNGKMSEFAAAVGLSSLESMPEFLQVNERNYHAYRRVFADADGVSILGYDERERNNFQYVVLEIDEQESLLTRDQWLQVLHAENVLARRYFYPGVHRMEPYCTLDPDAASRLPFTDAILKRVLVLPTGTAITDDDIETIGRIFLEATKCGARLRNRLPTTLTLPTAPLVTRQQEAA